MRRNFKFQIPNSNGFTLIELILYVVLVTLMLGTLIPFAWNVIEGGVKVSVEQEVYSQARYLSERIKKEVRDGSAINTCTSDASSGTLSIANSTGSLNPTVFSWAGVPTNQITISQGGGAATRIHSDDTSVTAFTCTNYQGAGTDNVQIILTISDNYTSAVRQEYNESLNVQLSAETRE